MCARVDEPLDHVEQPSLERFGLAARARVVWVAHTQKVEQQRQILTERFVTQQQRAGDLTPGVIAPVVFREAAQPTQDLQHGEERNGSPVGHAECDDHLDAAAATLLRELVAEATLSRPGRGDDADDLPGAGDRAA